MKQPVWPRSDLRVPPPILRIWFHHRKNSTAIIIFTVAVFVAILATVFVLWEMEVEPNSEYLPEGEPMLADGQEQGLPFPHVLGKDGQHTIQYIDM